MIVMMVAVAKFGTKVVLLVQTHEYYDDWRQWPGEQSGLKYFLTMSEKNVRHDGNG